MRRTTARLAVLLVSGLLGGLLTPEVGRAQTGDTPAKLTDVSVERGQDGVTVHVKTAGTVKYAASLIDSPTRLVIDLSDTVYGWAKTRMVPDQPPIREIRGSQFKPGVARLVVELSRPTGYRIDQGPDGLVVVIEPAASSKGAAGPPVATPSPRRQEPPVVVQAPKAAEPAPDGPKAPNPLAAAPATRAEAVKAVPVAAQGPTRLEPAAAPKRSSKTEVSTDVQAPAAAPAAAPTPPVVKVVGPLPSPFVGQAQTGTAPNGSKLISLDFKDADILNLLRILAAEGGRNIVAGDDVRGKVSLSLRNVTWDQALDTILEVRGLAKIEKGNVLRIVSIDQLTKEREALARVEDARRRAEIETRTKLAEAEIKEADLASRRLAMEAAAEEARRRGPLREETIRLSYADPEEVARTLQGILGIPPEGTQPVSTSPLAAQPVSVPSGSPLIAEPPFSQLYGPGAQPRPAPLVSVSQDVLAKGITIRAHKPTNTIFIRHYQSEVERLKKLIHETFDVPLPQVKIEARMEILDRNALEAIGVQWGGSIARQAGSTTVVGQGFQSAPGRVPGQVLPVSGGVLLPDGSTVVVAPSGPTGLATNIPLSNLFQTDSFTGLPTGNNLVNLPFQLLPGAASQIPAAGIAFGIIGTNFNVNLALQALATQGKTRTLARPEIVTVENAKATVSLGEEIPYATVSSAGTQIQFKEALLKLDVTPTVIRERIGGEEVRKIKMVVVVENNSRGDIVNLGAGGTPPSINRRKAETQVLIKEGDRLVIGGVTQSVTSTTVRKVPVLGDIPLLGWLFTYGTRSRTKTNLMVFLRPTVLREAQRAQSLTSERYDYIIGEQSKAQPPHSAPLPDMEAPTLPPR